MNGPLPTPDQVVSYFKELSNWGRWGEQDRLGTLNLITPDVRRRAVGLVRDGISVSLAADMDAADPDPLHLGTVLQRYMQLDVSGELGEKSVKMKGYREYIGVIPHGSHTHLDGLGHVSWDGKMYNNFSADSIDTINGSTELSMHVAETGFITRGVLLDIPAFRGVPWLEPGDAIGPDELDAAEKEQGLTVGTADALLVYTGNFERTAAGGLDSRGHTPGLSAACLPWLRQRDISMIGGDQINDVIPSGYDDPDLRAPIHSGALIMIGLWLLDNARLGDLAKACRTRSRWEFLFTMLPWRMVGVTSSPVNPVATF